MKTHPPVINQLPGLRGRKNNGINSHSKALKAIWRIILANSAETLRIWILFSSFRFDGRLKLPFDRFEYPFKMLANF
jgi:hypothetical protein